MNPLVYHKVSREEEEECLSRYKLSNRMNDLEPLFKQVGYCIDKVLGRINYPFSEKEDIVQELYEKIIRHIPKFLSCTGSPRFYTYFGDKFLRHGVLKYNSDRNRKKETNIGLWEDTHASVGADKESNIEEYFASSTLSPEILASHEEISGVIQHRLSRLTPNIRGAIINKHVNDCTIREISDCNGYYRGMSDLKEMLGFDKTILEEYL